jgi:phosphosulfolactate synthase
VQVADCTTALFGFGVTDGRTVADTSGATTVPDSAANIYYSTGRESDMDRFLDFADIPHRADKPRDAGVNVLATRIGIPDAILERFGEYIDGVKLLPGALLMTEDDVRDEIETLRGHDIDVQLSGVPTELARIDGSEREFYEKLRDLDVTIVEYSTMMDKPTVDEMAEEIDEIQERGFYVYGEVGSKWFSGDSTRTGRDEIDVQQTIDEFEQFLDAGCDRIYWEGLIVANLIGRKLDNEKGQNALREVIDTVGHEDVVFEVWGPRMTLRMHARLWAWLVREFGPDINIASVPPDGVPILETVRAGMNVEMDNPYVRWIKNGKPTENWWRMEAPPYEVGLERGWNPGE